MTGPGTTENAGWPVALILSAILLSGGCGRQVELPPTVPVRGKVVFRDGAPLEGGTIQFQSIEQPGVSASSVIASDGSFELNSFIAGARRPGAVAGRHRAIIVPPFTEHNRNAPTIPPQQVEVSLGENTLTITIDRQTPAR